MPLRIVIVVKRVSQPGSDQPAYQAQLRYAAGSNALFFSRRTQSTSAAKREAERVFGPLRWEEAPDRLKESEPECNQVAYLNYPDGAI